MKIHKKTDVLLAELDAFIIVGQFIKYVLGSVGLRKEKGKNKSYCYIWALIIPYS